MENRKKCNKGKEVNMSTVNNQWASFRASLLDGFRRGFHTSLIGDGNSQGDFEYWLNWDNCYWYKWTGSVRGPNAPSKTINTG